jgi:lactate dehydrogenase-like 2-hydroxyacid dehydrogenase
MSPTKPELLVTKPIYAPTLSELERDFTIHKLWTAREPAAFLKEIAGEVRAAVTTTSTGFTRAEFDALPNLEILANWGPYLTLIDLPAAREKGVAVTYTPDSTAEPVADLAMGMVVAVMRGLLQADRFVRSGQWADAAFGPGREVHGNTCGIVGFGRIGRELAKRATGFDMNVCYYGPSAKSDMPYRYFDDLEALARACDCLVVACALTPSTRNLIDRRILRALGKDGFLVNIARGAIVDEDALVAALEEKEIAGAALDVFRDEPHVPAALMKMDNVVLAPHIGTSTREVRENRSAMLLRDLRAYLEGEPFLHAAA